MLQVGRELLARIGVKATINNLEDVQHQFMILLDAAGAAKGTNQE